MKSKRNNETKHLTWETLRPHLISSAWTFAVGVAVCVIIGPCAPTASTADSAVPQCESGASIELRTEEVPRAEPTTESQFAQACNATA